MSQEAVVSTHLPGHIAQQLVLAAAVGDIDRIDEITDQLARDYPRLVFPRSICREQFVPSRDIVVIKNIPRREV